MAGAGVPVTRPEALAKQMAASEAHPSLHTNTQQVMLAVRVPEMQELPSELIS